ncbi:dihydrolipoamide acetyltransferase family protein [Candidatus Omnitrophota bacterium]
MVKPVMMPQVGQDIETAVILEWRVKENEPVNKGDILFVVESDKAVFEIEAYDSGVLLKILCREGEVAQVLSPVAYIGESGEEIDGIDGAVSAKSAEIPETHRKAGLKASAGTEASLTKIPISPSARRHAKEQGIDLSTVTGTGPNGRIQKQDVLDALKTVSSGAIPHMTLQEKTHSPSNITSDEKPEDMIIPFTGIRMKTASRLQLSKQSIPHFYLTIDVDVTDVKAARYQYNKSSEIRISLNDILMKATADTLTNFRRLNAHVENDRLIVRKNINIGMAVSTDNGLLVLVIEHVDSMDISVLSTKINETIQNVKNKKYIMNAIGTFTISNLSMYHITSVLPIINPPECAILGVGSIRKTVVPVGRDNRIEVRELMTLTLSCDHRAVDGVYASGFLHALKRNVEKFSL